ncbi:MAG: 30S ribosomal protein S6 [Patescibacteria group bacterium]
MKYDLTVLVKGAQDKDAFADKLEKLVKVLSGKLGKLTEMGKKPLAYKIKHVAEAIYLNWIVELPGPSVVELEKKLTNDKEVLRHLLVKAE